MIENKKVHNNNLKGKGQLFTIVDENDDDSSNDQPVSSLSDSLKDM